MLQNRDKSTKINRTAPILPNSARRTDSRRHLIHHLKLPKTHFKRLCPCQVLRFSVAGLWNSDCATPGAGKNGRSASSSKRQMESACHLPRPAAGQAAAPVCTWVLPSLWRRCRSPLPVRPTPSTGISAGSKAPRSLPADHACARTTLWSHNQQRCAQAPLLAGSAIAQDSFVMLLDFSTCSAGDAAEDMGHDPFMP